MDQRAAQNSRSGPGHKEPVDPGRALRFSLVMLALLGVCCGSFSAERKPADTGRGDRMLSDYFRAETAKIAGQCLGDIKDLADWRARRETFRKQLLEMLGLDPFPEKTDLKPAVTGKVEHSEFTVDNVHFQSKPGLYVTGNLYIPKNLDKPAPAILYLCGHSGVKKNNVSYGNKVSYQHHGAWFARHGYVCLVIDSLQLGEIEGIHHGTYRYNMWWWNSRGYSPAGVEAWNCIRALDYLETRPEVDRGRIGVTGRSGGGAYSWWVAAIDERVKAAVPVAGITDIQNHVVNGCVEGHCDCMYIVNTYRWDYPLVAALVAPRALLISNSDKDDIFPLDGVYRLYEKVRRIYALHDAQKNLGLNITEGPHKDTQELQVYAFVWFNRFLKNENPLIDKPAVPFLEPEQLKVFAAPPQDQINTQIHESFVPKAGQPSMPASSREWAEQRDSWMQTLREKVFRGWPSEAEAGPLDTNRVFCVERHGIVLGAYDFTSQPHVQLRLYTAQRSGMEKPELVSLLVLDEQQWTEWLAAMRVGFADELTDQTPPEPNMHAFGQIVKEFGSSRNIFAYFAPRGIGRTAWSTDEKKKTQILRRFMLLGQTADGMRVWDLRRAIQTLRSIEQTKNTAIEVQGCRETAGIVLYGSLFEPQPAHLGLWLLPESHRDGPTFLNVQRYLDMPQAVAMAAERSRITLYQSDNVAWQFPREVANRLRWPEKQFEVKGPPAGGMPQILRCCAVRQSLPAKQGL